MNKDQKLLEEAYKQVRPSSGIEQDPARQSAARLAVAMKAADRLAVSLTPTHVKRVPRFTIGQPDVAQELAKLGEEALAALIKSYRWPGRFEEVPFYEDAQEAFKAQNLEIVPDDLIDIIDANSQENVDKWEFSDALAAEIVRVGRLL